VDLGAQKDRALDHHTAAALRSQAPTKQPTGVLA